MKKKIKSAFLVVLTLALVSAAAVAITWAFDAPEAKLGDKTNTFTSGNITTQLTERAWDNSKSDDDTGSDYDNKDLGQTKAKNYMPGASIPKNPKMTNNSEHDINEYVAIRASFYIMVPKETSGYDYYFYTRQQFESSIAQLQVDKNGTVTPNNGADDVLGIGTDWTQGSNNSVSMFYYAKPLKSTKSTDSTNTNPTSSTRLFDSVKINTFSTDSTDGKYKITVYSNAVSSLASNIFESDNSSSSASSREIKSDTLPEFHIVMYGYAISADGYDATSDATAIRSALDKLAGIS